VAFDLARLRPEEREVDLGDLTPDEEGAAVIDQPAVVRGSGAVGSSMWSLGTGRVAVRVEGLAASV
jgi:hypothetical protein